MFYQPGMRVRMPGWSRFLTVKAVYPNGTMSLAKEDGELLRANCSIGWEIMHDIPKTLAQDLKLEAGRKDDGGKAPWRLLMQGCALGLAGVVSVLKFGAQKYAANSWQKVENAEVRYTDALYRHLHSIELRGFMATDPETGLLEWFHVACNALFLATFAAMKAVAAAGKETH